jgi:hypothetical protein
MRTLILLLTIAFATRAQTLLKVDFETEPAGAYTLAQCKKAWPGVTWEDGLAEGRGHIVSGDSAIGKSLRIGYPLNSFGPQLGGAQWRAFLPQKRDTVTMSYRIRFGTTFDFVKGGKLPGLCGSKCNTGGNVPNDTDGWSARLMWRDTDGKAVQYLYYPGQSGTYGADLAWKVDGKPCVFVPGTWHEVRTRIILNTPRRNGQPALTDGRITSWFDGKLALDTTGFKLRGEDTMHIDQFYFSTFHGGSDATWAPARDVSAQFDDFQIVVGGPESLGVPSSGTTSPRLRLVRKPDGSIAPDRPLPAGTSLRLFRPDGQVLSNPNLRGSILWRLEDLQGRLVEQGSAVLP